MNESITNISFCFYLYSHSFIHFFTSLHTFFIAELGSAKYSKEQVFELFAIFEKVLNTSLLPGIFAFDQVGCAYRRWRLQQLSPESEKSKEEKLDQKENLEEEDDEESEEDSDFEKLDANDYKDSEEKEKEKEKKRKELNDYLFDFIEKQYHANVVAFYQRLLLLHADPNQAREGQLNLWPAVFKVLKFADATFSKEAAYELQYIIRELCGGLSTRQAVFEEVATLLAMERAVAREEGHTERCFTEEEEALLYELLAEIHTQMQTKTTRTKEDEDEEEDWKLGVMTLQMCKSSDGASPKNYVVFTFRPYTAEEEVNRPKQSDLLFVPFRLLKRLSNLRENSL